MGGTAGSSDVFGMPCATNQDCPSGAICCDSSTPGCDVTRLPSGDGANPGEFVVSADGLTTTDTITGLVWQRDGSGTPAECSSIDNTCTWDLAKGYCSSLVLSGMSGWRFPGWMELLTILDLTTGEYPTTDKTAFPDTVGWYWTSSVYPAVYGVAPDQELYVSFGEGAPGFCQLQPYAKVQCVRGARCYPTSRFVVLDGGLVRDTLTRLEWQQQGSSTTMSWADAQIYCSSLISGFRLPTLKELDSLVDPTAAAASGPTIDKAFPDTGGAEYWTSSPYVGPYAAPSGDARYGDFSKAGANNCEGNGNWASVVTKLMVRCVR
jgi:hypothetical protein